MTVAVLKKPKVINDLLDFVVRHAIILAVSFSFLPRPCWMIGIAILIFAESRGQKLSDILRKLFKEQWPVLVIVTSCLSLMCVFHSSQDVFRYYLGGALIPGLLSVSFISSSRRLLAPSFSSWKWIVCFVVALAFLQFFGVLNTSNFSSSLVLWGAPVIRTTGMLPHATSFAIALFSLLLITSRVENVSAYQKLGINLLIIAAIATTQVRTLLLLSFVVSIWIFFLPSIRGTRLSGTKILYLVTGVGFFLITSLIVAKNTDLLPARYSQFLSFKGSHGQRLREQILAIEIIKKFPEGIGYSDIDQKFKNFKANSSLSNQPWLFSQWRGIHNAFLNEGAVWGYPGLVLVIFSLFWPLFFRIRLKKKVSSVYFVWWFAIILYCFTDSIYYIEILPLVALALSGEPIKNNGDEAGKFLVGIPAIILVMMIALGLPRIREWQIRQGNVVSIIIDNPLDVDVEVSIDHTRRIILANEYFVAHVIPGELHNLKLENARTGEQIFDWAGVLERRFLDVPRDFWFLTTKNVDYRRIMFVIDSGRTVEKSELVFPANALELKPLDEDLVRSGVEYMEETPLDLEYKTIKKSSGEILPALSSPFLVRSVDRRITKYFCWEPSRRLRPLSNVCEDSSSSYSVKAVRHVFRLSRK